MSLDHSEQLESFEKSLEGKSNKELKQQCKDLFAEARNLRISLDAQTEICNQLQNQLNKKDQIQQENLEQKEQADADKLAQTEAKIKKRPEFN